MDCGKILFSILMVFFAIIIIFGIVFVVWIIAKNSEPIANEIQTNKWQIYKAPKNTPIVCQFENHDKPGTYYYADVIHVGDQWILHVPDGEPTISISQTPPRRWSLVP